MSSRRNHPDTQRQMMEGAIHYANFDKSDPFTLRRAITHIKNGVASPSGGNEAQKNGQHGYYDADPTVENRSYTTNDGNMHKYQVPAFKNMARP